MPTVEGLQFAYALYALPPGRLPFGRWRWELWHGATMVAAGWRLSRPQAGRALRLHAAEFGHKLFGLQAPAREAHTGAGDLRPGAPARPSGSRSARSPACSCRARSRRPPPTPQARGSSPARASGNT